MIMKKYLMKIDLTAVAIIALGLLLRIFLFVSGRNPLDGDEAVMGMMGADINHGVRIPIYFYGQHYMGTLEVPLIAFLQSLGPESWKFSAWPLRLTGWTYFSLLGVTHFLLCRYFFGRRTALWSLFFICVGPYFWMEYSVRLRHAPLMMVMGEAAALAAITLRERWRAFQIFPPKRWLLFGIIVGLAWWHYQLVIVFFPALALILLYSPSPISALFSATPDESRARRIAYYFAIILMAMPLLTLALLSLGKGSMWFWAHRDTLYYPQLMLIIVSLFLGGVALSLYLIKLMPESFSRRRAPIMALLGFFIASMPTIYYFAAFKGEFWVPGYALNLSRLLPRFLDTFLLEIAGFIEIVRYGQDNPSYSGIGLWSYIAIIIYGAGSILVLQILFKSSDKNQKFGVLFFLVLAVSVVCFNNIAPRSTSLEKPRFIFPFMLSASVVLGFFASHIMNAIQNGSRHAKWTQRTIATALSVGALVLWGSNWMSMRPVEMDMRTGFEKSNVEIIRKLEKHGVHRAMLHYNTDFMLLGHNLMFMSRMRIRFNEQAITDRFIGLVDPADYPGPLYAMVMSREEVQLDKNISGGFHAGPFFLYPLPEGEHVSNFARQIMNPNTQLNEE